MADRKVVKLTDGTEADFPISTSLDDIDKKLAADGLKRDSSVKPFADRGVVESTMAKINLPLVQGASALLGMPGAVMEGAQTIAEKIAQLYGRTPEQIATGRPVISAPTPSSITRAVGERVPLQRAESFPGQLAQTALRNIASAPVQGAVIPSLLSAVGEESLALPFRGTDLEPYARMVGGVATPLISAPSVVRSPLERMYTESTSRMSPRDIELAKRLQQQSFNMGMPTTSFEAMQQASQGRTTLPSLQRQTEVTPRSAPIMAEFMGTRGRQTQESLEQAFPMTTREKMGTEVQRSAQEKQRDIQKQITAQGGPAFEVIKDKKIPQSWMTNLENESAVISEASRAVDNIPAYQDLLKGYETNSIARIEAMRQFLSDKYSNLANAAQPGKVTGEMKAYDDARRKLLEKADEQVKAYKPAREQYQAIREKFEAPIIESPIPSLARTNELASQFGDVFAKNPAQIGLTPDKVKTTMQAMGKQDPNLPKEFLNQYMRASLESVQRAASTQAGTVGARFADTIVKNTTQRENLKTAFREVYGTKGTEAVKGLNVMLDVLESQGRRLPAGSPTAEKGMLAEESIGLLGKGFRNIPGVIGNLYQNIFYGRDYEKIAKAITSPNGIETLEAIAKAGKDQKKIGLAFTELQQIIKATEAEDQSVQFAR
jgi:hypothetical protein